MSSPLQVSLTVKGNPIYFEDIERMVTEDERIYNRYTTQPEVTDAVWQWSGEASYSDFEALEEWVGTMASDCADIAIQLHDDPDYDGPGRLWIYVPGTWPAAPLTQIGSHLFSCDIDGMPVVTSDEVKRILDTTEDADLRTKFNERLGIELLQLWEDYAWQDPASTSTTTP
jgi:hypothetical protein